MDWIVFGDDWGRHPTTLQHLVLNLPSEDRVIWIDSIGMRQPRLHLNDIKRLFNKAQLFLQRDNMQEERLYSCCLSAFERIKPKIFPFHFNSLTVRFNGNSLLYEIRKAMRKLTISDPILLTSNPVVVQYIKMIPHRKVAYLRLDKYDKLPGVDPQLVWRTEHMMYNSADVLFATAKTLLPDGQWSAKSYYLPQGVNIAHFAKVPLSPPRRRVLGFMGLIAEWIDFKLIEEVARAAPSWQLEFIGPVRFLPERLNRIPNVRFLPTVPFAKLPHALSGWSAGWIPFQVSELTEAVNPLKAREYLAAGLSTHCTPLPEAVELAESADIFISQRAEEIVAWLEHMHATDQPELRIHRRQSVQGESWSNRCKKMRLIIQES